MSCVVVFETRARIELPEDVDTVGKRLRENSSGWERFEVKREAVFINVANVLWVEERSPRRPITA